MSKKLALSFACGDYETTKPLADGAVTADGIDLTILTGPDSRERHWRMARNNEYDICEFNVGAYFMGRDQGMPWTALPVFLHRRFRHGFAFVNTAKGFTKPSDLVGKRIGGTNFVPAGSIWCRGILEEYWGLPHRSVTWVTERPEDLDFTKPADLRIEMIPASKSLDDMLVTGELDGMISPDFPESFLRGDPRVARLFPDYKQVETDYFKATGIFPIMHVTVVKREIIERHPWVAMSLMRAFTEAKALAYRRDRNPRVVPLAWFSHAWEEQQALMGRDPWAFGLTPANRKNLESVIRYTHRQGLTSRIAPLEELFLDTDEEALRDTPGKY